MLPWKLGPSHTQQSRPRAHGRRMVNAQRTATGRRVEWKTNTHRSSFHQHSFRGNKNTRTYNWSYDDRYTVHQADFSFQIHGCCSRRRFGGSHSVRPLFLLLLLDFHFVCLLSVMTSWSVKMVPPFPSSQPVTFSPLPFPMPVCGWRSRRQANVRVSLNRHHTAWIANCKLAARAGCDQTGKRNFGLCRAVQQSLYVGGWLWTDRCRVTVFSNIFTVVPTITC